MNKFTHFILMLFLGILSSLNISLVAQVKIGDNSKTLHPYTILELESNNKGFLFPRMTSSERNAAFDVSKAPVGLTIFNTTTNKLEILYAKFNPSGREVVEWKAFDEPNIGTGDSVPENPRRGEVFMDTSTGMLMIYDGNKWNNIQTTVASSSDGSGNEFHEENFQVLTFTNAGELKLGTVSINLKSWLEEQGAFRIGGDNQQLSYQDTTLILENGGSVDLSNLLADKQTLQLGTTASATTAFNLTDGGSISLQASGAINFDTNNGALVLHVPQSVGGGAFSAANNIVSNASNGFANEDFVFGSDQLDKQTGTTDNKRFFFDKSSGAFRAGQDATGVWNTANRGDSSIGLGFNTKATGDRSVALGNTTNATAYSEVVLGSFNTAPSTTPNAAGWTATDRLLTVGNGASETARSNALTILKNGNVGIGHDSPTATLTVSGTTHLAAGLKDGSGNLGSAGQVLSTTGTSTSWITVTGTSNSIQEKTSNYTAHVDDGVILVTPASPVTITLPVPTTADNGKKLTIKRTNAFSSNATLELVANTGTSFDGTSNLNLNVGYQGYSLQAHNGNWYIVERF